MATRVVEIAITGEGGSYEATVNRIIDKNTQLNKDAIRGAQQSSDAFSKWQATIITLNQGMELLGRAAGTLKNTLESFIGAASQQEDAINRLNAAMQLTGRNIPTESMTKFATEMQKATRFGDEQVLSVTTLLAQLTNLDEKGLKLATQGVIGLASVLEKDLNSAAMAVARALSGNVEGLKRIGIQIDATLPLHKQQEAVLQRLQQLYGRAEADTRTYAGATAQLREVVGDLREELGAPLIRALTGVARSLTPIVFQTIEWTQRNSQLVASLVSISAIIVGAGGLVFALGLLASTLGSFITNPAGFAAFLALAGVGAATFLIFRNRINEFTETLTKAAAQAGLERMVKQLEDLKRVQDEVLSRRRTPAENAQATVRSAEITALEKQIEERRKLIKEFETLEFKGGALPQIIDPNVEKQRDLLASLEKQMTQLKLASTEFARSQGELSADVKEATFALIDQDREIALIAARKISAGKQILDLIKALAEEKKAQFDAAEAARDRREEIERLTQALKNEEERERELGQLLTALEAQKIAQFEEEFTTKQQLLALDVQRLRILGLEDAAHRQELENIIQLNEERKKEAAAKGILLKDADVRQREADNARLAIERLGEVSINIGQHVARSLEDIFSAMISGTLKGVDIARTATATLGRIVTDIFAQTIRNKLSFEFTLFNNLRGLPGQAQGALAAGGVVIPGGGGGLLSGLGDIFTGLFGGRPAGVEGPLMQSGQFVSGLPLGNVAVSGAAGGLLGSLFGGQGGIGGTIGGLAGSLLGGTSIGASISGSVASAIGSFAGSTIGGIAGNFVLPGIGMLLGGLIGGLFGRKSRRATSPQRRAKAFQMALGTTTGLGYELTEEEQQVLANAAQSIAGTNRFNELVSQLSLGALVTRVANQQAKGGGALSGTVATASGPMAINIIEELLRRGIDVSKVDVFEPETAKRLQTREKFREQFQDTAASFALELSGTIVAAINEIQPRDAFRRFMSQFSDAISGALIDGLATSFISQQIQPIIEGPIQDIFERFSRIGETITAEEALQVSRPDIESIRSQLDAMQPLFLATAELGRVLVGEIRSILPSGTAAGATNNINITINGDINDEADVRTLAQQISDMLSGRLAPAQ